MALWLKLFLSVFLPIAALVAVAVLVYRRRSSSSRNAQPELPESVTGGGGGGDPAVSPGLGKLNIRYNATSGRAGLRFQQLHHHHGHVDVRHHHRDRGGGGGAQQGPFQWADHPRLVTEAAENGWAQFVFAVAPPRTRSASSSPLWGLCPACDSGPAATWRTPRGRCPRVVGADAGGAAQPGGGRGGGGRLGVHQEVAPREHPSRSAAATTTRRGTATPCASPG